MTSLHQKLFAFWSQFTHEGKPIPAYYAGMVPNNAQFPYITFSVSRGDAFSQGINTAFVWFRRENGESPMPKCAAVLGQIAEAIPRSGTIIKTAEGRVALYRNGSDWQTYMPDAEDPDVLGGRTSYQINYYL